jgi:hypothetical protein
MIIHKTSEILEKHSANKKSLNMIKYTHLDNNKESKKRLKGMCNNQLTEGKTGIKQLAMTCLLDWPWPFNLKKMFFSVLETFDVARSVNVVASKKHHCSGRAILL